MKYSKPILFVPNEKDFANAGRKVAMNLSDKLQIKTPAGKVIQGKRKSN